MPDQVIRIASPHAGQRAAAAGRRRFHVQACGRRFGKSMGAVSDAAAEMMNTPGMQVGWFAPTYKHLLDPWRLALTTLRPAIVKLSEQEKRFELWNGATFECWSLDNPDAGRSRRYGLAVIDEAALVPRLEECWTASIRPTLSDLRGRARFFSTPKGLNYFYDLYKRGASDEWPEWSHFTAPTSANPFIADDEIEAARRELPSLVFRQEYLAEFVDAGGTTIARDWLRYGDPPGGLRVTMGCDLAISERDGSDWTACAVLGAAPDGGIWVLEVSRVRASFQGVLSEIKRMAAKWAPVSIAIEQVQYQAAAVQELQRTTQLPVRGVRPDKDKVTRFLPLAARYESGLVRHAHGLSAAFEDELLAFPLGQHDDQVDALAYAYSAQARQPALLSGAAIAAMTGEDRENPWI